MGRRAVADRAAIAVVALLVAVAIGWSSAASPVLALAGAAGLAVVALVLFDARALLLVVLATMPWDDMLLFPTETVSVVKILGGLLLLAYLLRAIVLMEEVRLPPTLLALLAFVLFTLLALLAAADPATGLPKTLRYLLFVVLVFLVVQLLRSRADVLGAVRVLALSTTAAAAWGVTLFLTGAETRAAGPIGEANDFAYLIATVVPLAAYLAARDRRRRAWWAASLVVLAGTLLATLSRGALVGFAALAVWGILSRRVRWGTIVAGLLAGSAAAAIGLAFWGPLIEERLAQKDKVASENVASRQALWSAAGRMAADHPVLGVGPDGYGERASTYLRNEPTRIQDPVAHNAYLEVLAEGGVFSLLALLAFLAGSWALLHRARAAFALAADRDGVLLVTAVQAGLLVAVVSASFLSVQIMPPLWVLGALAACLWCQAVPRHAR